MPARPQPIPEDQMTIEEFLVFTQQRPDEERWELIEGVPVMSPSPTDYHQIVVANLIGALMVHKLQSAAPWLVLPGTGTRVPASERSLPQPDVLVKQQPPTGSPVTDEALVIIEVLSRCNTAADQAWRRQVYPSVPNCQHYVTVSMKSVEIVVHDRSRRWKARSLKLLSKGLDLPALGLAIPLTDIYRSTPLGVA